MINTKFSPWPNFTTAEVNAVSEVLLSNKVNYWTGEQCNKFEDEFAKFTGTKHAVSLANGTVALDAALKALDIGAGDEVVVTPRSFFASVSCVVNSGAIPVFADVCNISGNITAATIAKVISPKTKAIICVHLAGWPCDMDAIMKLANEFNIALIEDCAQAHGAIYKNRHVGSIGHIGTWSFCQDKIMTTGGEGGMVTTNDDKLWRRMWAYKDHGKSYSATHENEHKSGYRWLHESFGTNARMTEMQAAIGRIQIKKMPNWNKLRTANAHKIIKCCQQFTNSMRAIVPVENLQHAWYKCYVYIITKGLKKDWNRDKIIKAIGEFGVPCYSGSCAEIYLEKSLVDNNLAPKDRLPQAKELGDTSLMFLVHPTLTTEEITLTCKAITAVMRLASK